MPDLKEQLAVAEGLLARNLAWIAAADSKVSTIFTIDATMLGVLAALAPALAKQWQVIPAIAAFLTAIALIASAVYLSLAAFPRLNGPKGSIVFFGSAVSLTDQDFVKRVQEGITEALVRDIANQAFRNAEIARAKYHHLKSAQILMFIGAGVWLVALALLYHARAG